MTLHKKPVKKTKDTPLARRRAFLKAQRVEAKERAAWVGKATTAERGILRLVAGKDVSPRDIAIDDYAVFNVKMRADRPVADTENKNVIFVSPKKAYRLMVGMRDRQRKGTFNDPKNALKFRSHGADCGEYLHEQRQDPFKDEIGRWKGKTVIVRGGLKAVALYALNSKEGKKAQAKWQKKHDAYMAALEAKARENVAAYASKARSL